MNLKRFIARTSKEALAQVRHTFGADAVVLSTRPNHDGVEVVAMAPDSVLQLEQIAVEAEPPRASAPAAQSTAATPVEQDVQRMAMSTLSFQDYVRERLLRRRRAALAPTAAPPAAAAVAQSPSSATAVAAAPMASAAAAAPAAAMTPMSPPAPIARSTTASSAGAAMPARYAANATPTMPQHPLPLHDVVDEPVSPIVVQPPLINAQPLPLHAGELRLPDPLPSLADPSPAQRERTEVLSELRAMKGLIEERFSALAFMEQMQRNPRQAALAQRLLEAGFSPALIRKLVEHLPHDVADEMAWASTVLQRNLLTDETGPGVEDSGGVFALIGATGVGKTTSTAKIAAAFATRHGAANLGLITLDAYRMAAHEQLRAYGRILGVPVHTAHDRASLDDLLELLAGKKLVLIDTAGMAQRDERTNELLEMLAHRSIQRLLVLNAATQGETVEDVMQAYRASRCRGAIVSKIDEAARIAPTLDALVRHKLRVVGVANGQRVPEDWHRLSSAALIQRALRAPASPAWRVEPSEINLVFAATASARAAAAVMHA